jgi:hypothetical protein
MTQLKSKKLFMDLELKNKSIEVKLNEVMREFSFIFHKMDYEHRDFYLFELPNDSCYIVFIKDNKLVFEMISGHGKEDCLYSETFKSVKSLRNRLCQAI